MAEPVALSAAGYLGRPYTLARPADLRRRANRFGNPPTAVAAAISQWIGRNRRSGKIEAQVLRQMEDQLSKLVEAQSGCEKIRKTPLPFAYVVMIKQFIAAGFGASLISPATGSGSLALTLEFVANDGVCRRRAGNDCESEE